MAIRAELSTAIIAETKWSSTRSKSANRVSDQAQVDPPARVCGIFFSIRFRE